MVVLVCFVISPQSGYLDQVFRQSTVAALNYLCIGVHFTSQKEDW